MSKLTWNKPATKQFFKNEKICGVQVKIENGLPMFRAATEHSVDVIPFDTKDRRGGLQLFLDGGSRSEELLNALRRNNTDSSFYTLWKNDDGWIEPIPFKPYPSSREVNGEHILLKAPPKFEPHIRVWDSDEKPITETAQDVSIEEARKIVAEYEKNARPGRPPKAVSVAKAIIAQSAVPDVQKENNVSVAVSDVVGELLKTHKMVMELADRLAPESVSFKGLSENEILSKVVAAYVAHNDVSVADIPNLVQTIRNELFGQSSEPTVQPKTAEIVVEIVKPEPEPIKETVQVDENDEERMMTVMRHNLGLLPNDPPIGIWRRPMKPSRTTTGSGVTVVKNWRFEKRQHAPK